MLKAFSLERPLRNSAAATLAQAGFTKTKGLRLERVNGIEPSSSAWKAVALPLSYTRKRNGDLPLRPRKGACLVRFASVQSMVVYCKSSIF